MNTAPGALLGGMCCIKTNGRGAGAPDVSAFPGYGFSDVSLFFEDAVRWAKANGLFDGFPDDTFRQNNPTSRGTSPAACTTSPAPKISPAARPTGSPT